MKITVFTCNQERHMSLIKKLAGVADEVFAIHECRTLFPGIDPNYMYYSDIMRKYFEKVMEAEKYYFGNIGFMPSNVYQIPLMRGDLNRIPLDILEDALASDLYIVFGSGFIKGEWIDYLIRHNAVNIHMGVSPYYRGSACNFWAAYDGNPDYVGATIHMLSKGLDSGDMLYHALPEPQKIDTIFLGMAAVRAAQDSLVEYISSGDIFKFSKENQSKEKEIRYSREKDFNDIVAEDYMKHLMEKETVYNKLKNRNMDKFKDAYVG